MVHWTQSEAMETRAGKATLGKQPPKTAKPSPYVAPQAAFEAKVALAPPNDSNSPQSSPATLKHSKFDFLSEWQEAVLKGAHFAKSVTVVIKIQPVPAPRMTQRDKWLKPRRLCVQRYFDYKDKLRTAILNVPKVPDEVSLELWFSMPDSWSEKKKAEMDGKPHRIRPDRDNCDKAVCDALFKEDGAIWRGKQTKRWCFAGQERVEVTLVFDK